MALHPIPADVAPAIGPGDLEIRQAVDAAGLEDHVAVVSAGFGMPIDLARRLVPVEELGDPGHRAVRGLRRRSARGDVDGLHGRAGRSASTTSRPLEDARRRGYGAAVTRRAIADGVARGATVAILQSSDMGRPVYEAIGFREVLAFRVFVDDGTGLTPAHVAAPTNDGRSGMIVA